MDYEKFIEAFNKGDRFGAKNKIRLISLEQGCSEVEMEADESDFNYMDNLHGGAIFLISDIAAGTAVASFGTSSVTLNSSVNFVKRASAGKIYATASVMRKGRTISICNVKVFNENRDVISTSAFTMFETGKKID